MSGAAGAAAGYATVRNNFNHPGMYGAAWYGDHQGAWAPTGWAAGSAWTPATWAAVAGHLGYGNNQPVSYNYGDNVTCIGGNVVINGQPAGTAEEFSQQADEIAETGTNAEASPDDQWTPLGRIRARPRRESASAADHAAGRQSARHHARQLHRRSHRYARCRSTAPSIRRRSAPPGPSATTSIPSWKPASTTSRKAKCRHSCTRTARPNAGSWSASSNPAKAKNKTAWPRFSCRSCSCS